MITAQSPHEGLKPVILVGHNITELRKLPEKSVHCVVTSPPYWGLRAYGTEPQVWGDGWVGELGSEPTPELFVAHMVEVFAEVWRVLRDDGTCWVNLGDSYATGGGKVGSCPGGGQQGDQWKGYRGTRGESAKHSPGAIGPMTQPNRMPIAGLKPKDLVGIPWRVAFGLQAAGWYLRQEIIWHKPNPMPESVTDRCTKSHEQIFLLTKSQRYYFDAEAIKTPSSKKSQTVYTTPRKGDGTESTGEKLNKWMEENGGRYHPSAANRRSVWSISTHSFKGAHFATFPPRLVEPCVLAGTSARGCCHHCGKSWVRIVESQRIPTRPGTNTKVKVPSGWETGEGSHGTFHRDGRAQTPEYRDAAEVGNRDPQRHIAFKVTMGWKPACTCDAGEPIPCIVLDPFGGSGTTEMVSEFHGRRGITIELNEKYAELARARIAEGWTPPKAKKPRKKKPGSVSRQLSLIVE
jgi:DNA modification methylase